MLGNPNHPPNAMKRNSLLLALSLTTLFAACQSNTEKRSASPDADMMAAMQDPEAMAAMMAEYGALAAEAENLGPMAGSFTSTTSYWMAPDQPPMVSAGSCEAAWILGGRFLHQSFKGDMMGQPFEGQGWIGWDKVRGAYVSMWIDNFSTAMMDPAEGQLAADGKTVVFVRNTDTPMGPMTMKEVYAPRAGGYDLTMYMVMEDGSEVKSMHIANETR